MNNTQKISELNTLPSEQITGNENIALSTPNLDSGYTSKKTSFSRLGSWLNNCFNFNNLKTQNKNIIGAINEFAEGGSVVIPNSAPAHNAIYRGKWLGTAAPTEAQYQAIYNGSFEDLYVGDYWCENPDDITKPRWRIAGFNYYHNTGMDMEDPDSRYVLTNHAVIIPDLPIVDEFNSIIMEGTGIDDIGGYKYSAIRGYKCATEGQIPTLENGQYVIRLNHIPAHITCISSTAMTVYDKNNPSVAVANPNNVMFEWSSFGEDPDHPGKGIVKLNGKFIDYYTDSFYTPTLYPSDWYVNFQYGSLYVSYQYYNGNGGLQKAEQIINSTFGSEHIMHHNIPLTVCGGIVTDATNSAGLQYDMGFRTEWTDVTVELPTVASIFGNSTTSCYNEYRIWEYDKQGARPQSEYLINNNAPNPVPYNSEIRYPIDTIHSHIENYQLPLFLYDPNLIHVSVRQDHDTHIPYGPGYLLRNIAAYDRSFGSGGGKYINLYGAHCRYLTVEFSGVQAWYQDTYSFYNKGTRPIFCISATSDPHSPPTQS